MTSKSPLPKLPTIGELLSHPRVQGVVSRINQTTIATRAGEFFDEIRSGLVERAGVIETPSLTHLAERFVRRILGETPDGGLLINATGMVVGDPLLAPPLAESAIYEMLQLGSEYLGEPQQIGREVGELLCRFAGAEAAAVTATFEGALSLMLAGVGSGNEFVVRGAATDADDRDWPKLAAQYGAILRPAGEGEASVIVSAPEACLTTPGSHTATSNRRGTLLVDVAPLAGIENPAQYDLDNVPTLAERIAAGVGLVVAAGAGLIGGPDCGIVVGSKQAVEKLLEHPLYPAVQIPVQTAAALRATLRTYETPQRLAFETPVWQLLSTPIENLEQRAERLAPLLAECPTIGSVEPVACESPWATAGGAKLSSRSWALKIEPAAGRPETLQADLRRRQIATRLVEDQVWMDLRAVFARWDQRLAAVAGELGETNEDDPRRAGSAEEST